MDGRKIDWIREQLGLSKAELTRQHGISRQSLYRCIWDGAPRLVALAIVGLWIPGSHGVLEERSEPQEGMTRIPKGRQGIRCAKKKDLKFFVENVTVRYILAIQYLPKKQQKPCSLIRR
jgi:hypothetical protein